MVICLEVLGKVGRAHVPPLRELEKGPPVGT